MASVYFITGNANKLKEVKAVLEPHVEVSSQAIDLEEIQGSIEEVTIAKCTKAAVLANGPVLVEDTALSFNALNGLPGPYIKWFLSDIGLDGLNNLLAAYPNKEAEAICTFGYCAGPGEPPILFQGRVQGKIVPPRGGRNFGWDPIFEYEGKTFAEMDVVEKTKISHRGKALDKLQSWLREQPRDTIA
ncbi:Putative Inosine triphosphate pyrophosphatase [[Torrubiella] hemipterigena]|uniref:Inosine triphosphate pyrophosphatase n=1 Tax=[Torrubiella] hemipterigena TaxID=1531966 RepID=A0A0A1THW0_9HYPO|nr:Putative Inosine triphosphate pyrophosphatase [[Torrubiella] hemipterigena]